MRVNITKYAFIAVSLKKNVQKNLQDNLFLFFFFNGVYSLSEQ